MNALPSVFAVVALVGCFPLGCGARSELDAPPAGAGAGGGASSSFSSTSAFTSTSSSSMSSTSSTAASSSTGSTDCQNAGITYIYLISQDNRLMSFYPPTHATKAIAPISCPSDAGATPYSMGVSQKGEAYVLFSDGNLFLVSTKDASCKPTAWMPNSSGFSKFGMGFSADPATSSEKLFIVQTGPAIGGVSYGLGSIDSSFGFTFVGDFNPPLASNPGTELTGTGDGRLFGYHIDPAGKGGHLIEIDKTNAHITSDTLLPIGDPASALAVAFWGGDFYVFTTNPMNTTETLVTRYQPNTHILSLDTKIDAVIVGAGVSTCAPM